MDASSRAEAPLWRLNLFDGPGLIDAEGAVTRKFRSQRIGALLAYLGLHLGRPVPREELYVALWPDDDISVTANRLRVCLSSLRRQLEPPGVTFGAVIDVSEPGRVRLRRECVWCDAAEFDSLWAAGDKVGAVSLAHNKALLPGYYDDWILEARNRYELLVEDVDMPVRQPAPAEPHSEAPTAPRQFTFNPRRLPLYLTQFFGRHAEILALSRMIGSHRLVTVAGPGGIGKTRLVVEAATKLDGKVLFVPLADVSDADQLCSAILRALSTAAQADADLNDQICAVIAHRNLELLILDNAEQVAIETAALCVRVLEACPATRIIVTSRQHLEIHGEAILSLSPLENPPHATSSEGLAEWPSTALFLNRARSIRPDFGFSSRSAAAVVEICQRLDGIPLAIELAAARTASETSVQIAASLNSSLIDLKARHRGLSERHRSLRAAIQSSYDRLSTDQRQFFGSLSLFHGGWTEEAACAVTASSQTGSHLESLVAQSLIVVQGTEANAMRFSFLEPLRHFAAETLTLEDRNVALTRHSDYYLSLAARISVEDIRPYILLDGEQENVLAALERRAGSRDIAFWRGLFGYVFHAWSRAEHRVTLKWIDEAAALLPQIEDLETKAGIMEMVTHVWPDIGRFEDTLRIIADVQSEGIMDTALHVRARITTGYVLNRMARYQEALDMVLQELDRARALDNHSLVLWALSMAAATSTDVAIQLGLNTQAGRSMMEQSERYCMELLRTMPEYSRYRSTAHHMLSMILDGLGRDAESYEMIKLAQRLCLEDKKLSPLMHSFLMEAVAAEKRGQPEYAGVLMGAVFDLQERMAFTFAEQAEAIQGLEQRLTEALGAETYQMLMRQGRVTSYDELSSRRLPQHPAAVSSLPARR